MNIVNNEKNSKMKFFIKASLFSSVLAMFLVVFLEYFSMNYQIRFDPQVERCLPDHTFYLIDTNDKEMIRGKIMNFTALGISPWLNEGNPKYVTNQLKELFLDGKELLKIVSGVPGDQISITEDVIMVNDKVIIEGDVLINAQILNKDKSVFTKTFTLGEGEYFATGTHKLSFDSRYWGVIHSDQVIGHGIPLF